MPGIFRTSSTPSGYVPTQRIFTMCLLYVFVHASILYNVKSTLTVRCCYCANIPVYIVVLTILARVRKCVCVLPFSVQPVTHTHAR